MLVQNFTLIHSEFLVSGVVNGPFNTKKLPSTLKFYRVNKLYLASMKRYYFSNHTIMFFGSRFSDFTVYSTREFICCFTTEFRYNTIEVNILGTVIPDCL